MTGNFFYYKFYTNNYQIKVLVQDVDTPKSYIIEEGKYLVKDSNITLIPKSQLFFKQQYTNISGPCSALWIFENTYIVNKDSLNKEEIAKFRFNKRTALIFRNNETINISDPRYQHMTVKNYCH